MNESQIDHRPVPTGAPGAGRNGGRDRTADLLDRSHLLRRETRFPFQAVEDHTGRVRLRRERRVSASFSAIRGLARSNGRH